MGNGPNLGKVCSHDLGCSWSSYILMNVVSTWQPSEQGWREEWRDSRHKCKCGQKKSIVPSKLYHTRITAPYLGKLLQHYRLQFDQIWLVKFRRRYEVRHRLHMLKTTILISFGRLKLIDLYLSLCLADHKSRRLILKHKAATEIQAHKFIVIKSCDEMKTLVMFSNNLSAFWK